MYGNLIQNPMVGIADKAMQDMMCYATEFGMTPSSKSMVRVDPENEAEDPAEGYCKN